MITLTGRVTKLASGKPNEDNVTPAVLTLEIRVRPGDIADLWDYLNVPLEIGLDTLQGRLLPARMPERPTISFPATEDGGRLEGDYATRYKREGKEDWVDTRTGLVLTLDAQGMVPCRGCDGTYGPAYPDGMCRRCAALNSKPRPKDGKKK